VCARRKETWRDEYLRWICGFANAEGGVLVAAQTVHGFAAEASFGAAAGLHLVGALSCLAALFVVSTIYQGALYRLTYLLLALVSFLAFSVWPRSGGALYGWFFRLF
jgi:hypothetical protein